jgi:hypothetical protein
MHPIPCLAVAALALCAQSCRAVAPATYAALETRASAPVVYAAELTSHAVRVGDLGLAWTEADESELSETIIDVHARIVSMRAADAAGAFGYRAHGKQALVVHRAAAERLLDRMVADGLAREINTPRVATRAGMIANISVINEVAYLESFRVDATDDVLIADPNVGVAQDGMQLSVLPTPFDAGDSIELSIEIVTASLARPIEAIQARIPGSATPVTLQTPVTMSQRLATVVRLGADDALVLGGLAGGAPDEFVFALVSAAPLVAGDDPSAPRAELRR